MVGFETGVIVRLANSGFVSVCYRCFNRFTHALALQFMHRYYALATRENRQTEKLTRAAHRRWKELDFYRLSDFDRGGFAQQRKAAPVCSGAAFLVR
ncbi:hypothetical protein [Rhizobium sp. AN80A]|uniref:hypothetical protein n=1 Tax=Rhizobium sp. AN80A TaxID=3040673 RepID=UPI0024B35C2D|nr:hypothetical protein [Rhizobium sp. AN80A]